MSARSSLKLTFALCFVVTYVNAVKTPGEWARFGFSDIQACDIPIEESSPLTPSCGYFGDHLDSAFTSGGFNSYSGPEYKGTLTRTTFMDHAKQCIQMNYTAVSCQGYHTRGTSPVDNPEGEDYWCNCYRSSTNFTFNMPPWDVVYTKAEDQPVVLPDDPSAELLESILDETSLLTVNFTFSGETTLGDPSITAKHCAVQENGHNGIADNNFQGCSRRISACLVCPPQFRIDSMACDTNRDEATQEEYPFATVITVAKAEPFKTVELFFGNPTEDGGDNGNTRIPSKACRKSLNLKNIMSPGSSRGGKLHSAAIESLYRLRNKDKDVNSMRERANEDGFAKFRLRMKHCNKDNTKMNVRKDGQEVQRTDIHFQAVSMPGGTDCKLSAVKTVDDFPQHSDRKESRMNE